MNGRGETLIRSQDHSRLSPADETDWAVARVDVLKGVAVDVFVHELTTGRVVFGVDSLAEVPAEVERLESSRVLLISGGQGKRFGDAVADSLGSVVAGRIDKVLQHVPVDAADAATWQADALSADALVAVGGGSAIGLAKAVARNRAIPILAVPTTYAGSEVSPIWGLTENGRKVTGRDPQVLPRTVVYDPRTTMSMPARLTATSGMNALAHAVEALYAPQVSPIVQLLSQEAIRTMATALPGAVTDPNNEDHRSAALYGAFLCGTSLGNALMGIHHKICHVLGGAYNLSHGDTHAAILPYAVAFNRDAAGQAMSQIASALGSTDAAVGLWRLCAEIGAPTSLADVGFNPDDIDDVARIVAEGQFPNPRPVTTGGVRDLLTAACDGRPPSPLLSSVVR
jgi:maleylacetate reductase